MRPEGCGGAISKLDLGNGAIEVEAFHDIPPDRSVHSVSNAQVVSRRPAILGNQIVVSHRFMVFHEA